MRTGCGGKWKGLKETASEDRKGSQETAPGSYRNWLTLLLTPTWNTEHVLCANSAHGGLLDAYNEVWR